MSAIVAFNGHSTGFRSSVGYPDGQQKGAACKTAPCRLCLRKLRIYDAVFPMALFLRKWAHLGSNQGPTGYEPVALPTELWALKE